jgi:uncharacterized protein with HEPN domain
MLEDANDAISFVSEIDSLESFTKDIKTRKAVVMSLLNIGELANHLPSEFTQNYDELPWRDMISMRNLAAHGYHVMNLDIIWGTVKNSLPPLVKFLMEQLQQANE